MSLRRFLNVAYAILVEEYQRMGIDLISALEKVADLGSEKTPAEQARPTPRAVAASNEQSMAMLKGLMARTDHNPEKKPRR